MVDYSQLPGGVKDVIGLRKSHPEVQISTISDTCCKLCGSYSHVQAALTQLLGRPGCPELAGNNILSPVGVQTSRKSQVSEEQSRKPKRIDNTKSLDEESSSSKRNLAPGGNGWEASAVNAALQSPATFTEDFSLMVDADMFQYLHNHCKKEYQHILSQYGVEEVTETNQGLTTLFLKVADAEMMGDRQERLKLARRAISCLYQENETKIHRDQLPKLILHPRGGLQRAMDNLSIRFPKILLNEDEQNIYIIGNSRDVSEAKGALLLDREEVGDEKEHVAGLPSYNFGSSSSHADEERVLLTPPFTVSHLDEGVDPTLRSEEDELRAEGATKYKLAARFKESRLSGLGSWPADFNFRTNSAPSRQTRHGPVLGHDVLSETAGISGKAVSRAQNTGGDILFNATHASSSASTQNETDTTDAHLKNLTSPFGPTPSSSSESTALPPFGSGSTLKRANSFSGTPQQKAQVVNPKSQDDSNKSTVRTRGRSSSFSSQAAKDKQEVHKAEIPVSKVVWQYIKEAYSPRVKDLTTEVQMEESASEGSRDLTVILKGADSAKVKRCWERLQNLVASVSADFSVQELRLSELGIADSENETLQACCSEVRSGFKKVTIHIIKKSLYVVGPVGLCSQVAATLREVFSGQLEQHGLSSPSTSKSATSSQFGVPQSLHLNNSQSVLGTQTGKTAHQQWKTTYGRDFGEKGGVNGSYSQSSTTKDLFDQAKVKTGTVKEDGHKADGFDNHLFAGSDKSLENGDRYADRERTLHATQTGSRQTEIQGAPDEPMSDQAGQVYNCVCGEDGVSLVRTNCGVTMCPKCLETRHVLCRVCTETEQTPRGILGEMKKSRLHLSLPGHNKDGVIKITYRIPDGIQGVSSSHHI